MFLQYKMLEPGEVNESIKDSNVRVRRNSMQIAHLPFQKIGFRVKFLFYFNYGGQLFLYVSYVLRFTY